MKALVIDGPWITAILKGDKPWEMRKKNCNIRGQIALIRKGSSQVVGTANVVDSIPQLAINAPTMPQPNSNHRILPARQLQAFVDGSRTPWVLANARTLRRRCTMSIHPAQWSR